MQAQNLFLNNVFSAVVCLVVLHLNSLRRREEANIPSSYFLILPEYGKKKFTCNSLSLILIYLQSFFEK